MSSASSSFKRVMGRVSSLPPSANMAWNSQEGTNLIRCCQSVASNGALQRYNCSLAASATNLRKNVIISKRPFSSAPTPFSRKKPVKVIPGEKVDTTDIEPRASFDYQATLGILQIARAVSPVVSMNSGYTLTSNFDLRLDASKLALEKEPVQLELNTGGKGSYLFTVDRELKRLNLVSPMSGGHSYLFDEEQQLWLSASDDRHDLRGMVTRDLLRHARGLATF